MKRKLSIVYAWCIRSITFFLPDIPLVMRMRGALYGFMMKGRGRNFQVAHGAILNCISELQVGENVYIANNTSLFCGGGVFIGDNVLVAPGVVVSSDNHTFLMSTGYRFGRVKFNKVSIASGSWICANVVITAGAVIARNSVVAPCSVYGPLSSPTENGVFSGSPAAAVSVRDL